MRRFIITSVLSLLLALLVVFPSFASAPVKGTSYSEQFVLGYSYADGAPTGTSHAFRVFIRNNGQKDITRYRITMRFYDAENQLTHTKSSPWQTDVINAGRGVWSPFLTAKKYTDHFTWQLSYSVAESSQVLKTDFMPFIQTRSHTLLKQRRSWLPLDTARFRAPDPANGVECISWQQKFLFNIHGRTGRVMDMERSFRCLLKNSSPLTVYEYRAFVDSYDSSKTRLSSDMTRFKRTRIKRNKTAWTPWLQIPANSAYQRVELAVIMQ